MATITIAAAGDLWTHRKVYRNEVPTPDGDEMITQGISEMARVHTGRSNLMLMEIHVK